jgi:hypothetical protein
LLVYVTNDNKVFTWLRNVSVKEVHISLQKTITSAKKFGKGRQECEWACFESKMRHKKLRTFIRSKFTNKFIIFEETFEY